MIAENEKNIGDYKNEYYGKWAKRFVFIWNNH
jgi:hypothetical protein